MSPKVLIPLFFFVLLASAVRADWRDDYDALLTKYATTEGVRYKAWKGNAADVARLKAVSDAIAKESLSGKSKNEKLAFYLNAYNVGILKTAVAEYPVKSLKSSEWGFFKKKGRLNVAGKSMSFDDLEHSTIRPQFEDARVHFALNCGARSCPPLHNAAFRGTTVDATLTQLTKTHLNHWRGVNISSKNGKVYVTKLFDWFEEDFVKSGGSVKGFIEKYRKLPKNISGHLDYDWSLNSVE